MSEKRKHIAIISTWFPPNQSVATNRILAFVDLLSEEYQVTVFSLDSNKHEVQWNTNAIVYYNTSNSFFERLQDKTTDTKIIHYAKVASRIILNKILPNPLKKWQKSTLKALQTKHNAQPFDLILSSYAPIEAHLIAVDFKQDYPSIPWVADMRDELTKNPYINESTRQQWAKIEQLVNQHAQAITSVSEPILTDFKAICPNVTLFEEIRNGYNHSLNFSEACTRNEIFTIGYFGTFYGEIKPDRLFRALINIRKQDPDFVFRMVLQGVHQNFTIPSELKTFIEILPAVPYLQAIENMHNSDLNVFLYPSGKRKGVYSGKLFDYISVKKPVLGLVDKTDVAAKLIIGTSCGYVADYFDMEEIQNTLLQAFSDWKQQTVPTIKEEDRLALHRSEQVKKLKTVINKLVKA